MAHYTRHDNEQRTVCTARLTLTYCSAGRCCSLAALAFRGNLTPCVPETNGIKMWKVDAYHYDTWGHAIKLIVCDFSMSGNVSTTEKKCVKYYAITANRERVSPSGAWQSNHRTMGNLAFKTLTRRLSLHFVISYITSIVVRKHLIWNEIQTMKWKIVTKTLHVSSESGTLWIKSNHRCPYVQLHKF